MGPAIGPWDNVAVRVVGVRVVVVRVVAVEEELATVGDAELRRLAVLQLVTGRAVGPRGGASGPIDNAGAQSLLDQKQEEPPARESAHNGAASA